MDTLPGDRSGESGKKALTAAKEADSKAIQTNFLSQGQEVLRERVIARFYLGLAKMHQPPFPNRMSQIRLIKVRLLLQPV